MMESKDLRSAAEPINFARRAAGSDVFKSLFREGMALVEQTATYLDGDGRVESRQLDRAASLAYATESMRLTTRLMQLASWLLLQRAVNEGEMPSDQASKEKAKIKIGGLSTSMEGSGWDGLPERLRDLIGRSVRLQERIRRLDGAMMEPLPAQADNPVASQLGRLAREFAK